MPGLKYKGFRGNASQFFVAGEICRHGFVAVPTLGNCPNTDVLCSNAEGTKFVHVQVKTFRPGDKTCMVGFKAEKSYGPNFFWVLGGIPEPDRIKDFEYYIIPAAIMSQQIRESHRIWSNTPGKKGQKHNHETTARALVLPPGKNHNGWKIDEYKNRWDLIEQLLK